MWDCSQDIKVLFNQRPAPSYLWSSCKVYKIALLFSEPIRKEYSDILILTNPVSVLRPCRLKGATASHEDIVLTDQRNKTNDYQNKDIDL